MVGIEIKSSSLVNEGDFAGLRALADEAGEKFTRGVLLYGGDAILPFGDKMIAMPVSAIWEL